MDVVELGRGNGNGSQVPNEDNSPEWVIISFTVQGSPCRSGTELEDKKIKLDQQEGQELMERDKVK